jgi:hypothetical protein
VLQGRSYAILIYMALALALGVAYFTWAFLCLPLLNYGVLAERGYVPPTDEVGGVLFISAIVAILFFFGLTLVANFETFLARTLLGLEPSGRRLIDAWPATFIGRVAFRFKDRRTWSQMLYMLAMLPLGTLYFIIAVPGLAMTLLLALLALFELVTDRAELTHFSKMPVVEHLWHTAPGLVLFTILGLVGFTLLLHIAHLVAHLHGRLIQIAFYKHDADEPHAIAPVFE